VIIINEFLDVGFLEAIIDFLLILNAYAFAL
jgi:hypothetical protein